jgi:hypothetical protein
MAEHFRSLHMQHIMESVFGDKMRNHDRNCFIRLAAGENFFDVIEQWLEKRSKFFRTISVSCGSREI